MTDSPIVTTVRHDRVLVATIDDGKANALATAVSEALISIIDSAESDPDVGALVIAGRPGRFSAGFDLGVFQSGDIDAVETMVATGGRLVARAYGSGVPIVAACTGHAVAGGALLLLGCDHRVGPDAPVKIGLNEVAIGMVLPDWGLAIASERLSRRHLQASTITAKIYDAGGAVDAGFLDVVVDPDGILDTAIEAARGLTELDPAAYAASVVAMRSPVLDRMATTTAA